MGVAAPVELAVLKVNVCATAPASVVVFSTLVAEVNVLTVLLGIPTLVPVPAVGALNLVAPASFTEKLSALWKEIPVPAAFCTA